VSAATVLRVTIAFLLALALVFLFTGDTGESGAFGAVAAVSVTGWALARRRRSPDR
jgi:uncharacterized membrane protein